MSLFFLQSCTISGGFGYHDTELDSEFKEDELLGWFQGDLHLTNNISLYARHESMPKIKERYNGRGGGYGANSLGISGKLKLFDRGDFK